MEADPSWSLFNPNTTPDDLKYTYVSIIQTSSARWHDSIPNKVQVRLYYQYIKPQHITGEWELIQIPSKISKEIFVKYLWN